MIETKDIKPINSTHSENSGELASIYQVCIPKTFRDFFDYRAEKLEPCIGARVWVPFGNKKRLGVVVGKNNLSQVANSQLKSIETVLDKEPLLCSSILQLCEWVSRYYQSPLSEVITLVLPKGYRLGKSSELPQENYYQLALTPEEAHPLVTQRSKKLHTLIDRLNSDSLSSASNGLSHLTSIPSKPLWFSQADILQQKFNISHIQKLIALNIIRQKQQLALPQQETLEKTNFLPNKLNEEQLLAFQAINQAWGSYHSFLLYGITGSGKTEVYLELINEVLIQKKQALVLVPEIGLTPQLLTRFSKRFNCSIEVIHSNLTENERQWAWQKAKENLTPLVIGTRTAIFTPMPNLALIIVDEEHDSSFKQQEGVRYSARDTALIRAQALKIPIVLGSATPSLESLNNCIQKKHSLLKLHFKALNQNHLLYHIFDLRNTRLKQGLTPQTLQIINKHLTSGNQVLVFINRRGFSPVLLCHACGWVARCLACDKPYTFHRAVERLLCHHCNLNRRVMSACEECQGTELIPLGLGTQRVHEYLNECFPNTAILRIDRDEIQKKQAFTKALKSIESGEVQLLIGTQMLAKGHHFPRLTLVVILDTDAGLYSNDFRGLERLGQLLTQVSGRAGRAEHPGEVIIQTYLPDHPLLNLLIQKGYDPFTKTLLTFRKEAQLPPYHFIGLIRAQHTQKEKAWQFLENIKNEISTNEVKILGPAFAPMPRKGNQYRVQLLLKSSSRKKLQNVLTQLRKTIVVDKLATNIRWNIDVDPIDLS